MRTLAFCLILLAGCTQPVDVLSGPGPSPTTPETIPEPDTWAVTTLDGPCPCFEPTIAVLDGWTFTTAAVKGSIIRIDPAGAIDAVGTPALPPLSAPGTYQNDAMVDAGDGSLHFHALLTRYDPDPGTMLLLGIQYARSDDHGETWSVNTFLGLPDGVDRPQAGADRQWLAISDDGTLYITYQQVSPVLGTPVGLGNVGMDPRGVRMARSDNGGATWTSFQTVTGETNRISVIAGRPVTVGDALHIPYFRYDRARLEMASTGDGGETWRFETIYDNGGMPGAWFPSLAAHNGSMHVAWSGPAGELMVSQRTDTWSAPTTLSAGPLATSPWMASSPAGLAVAWYEKTGTTTADMVLRVGDGPVRHIASTTGWSHKPAYTDFAHMVVVDEIHLTWSQPGQQSVVTVAV